MEVLFLTIFVSLVLVTGGAMFFAWIVRQRTLDQSDRLALLPLSEERPSPVASADVDREGPVGND